MSWVEIIGWSATAVGALLGFPQLFRLLRTRNVAGLSLLAWQAVLVLNVIWFTHGVRIGQGPQIVTNSVALVSTCSQPVAAPPMPPTWPTAPLKALAISMGVSAVESNHGLGSNHPGGTRKPWSSSSVTPMR